ncbi:MAG: bifunctional diaminohydroxyphosphoribosylaminopyrimidine deaminase/5-amino-6-(5-phosphoribosylamino)uracil reductase RibD [Candidatus Protistobacter heckmanni]|nr:bifunctional diaminohydroxyphosphoribosylaminopyrimidine deaminase/5-amino-6-(5-phosphoribosylamino)uracil reductase RibD [Candidatus Protistobacter heckmanni]
MYSDADFAMMRRALALAHKAIYLSSPNPRVGCVLVKRDSSGNDVIIGEGFTQPPGQDHAEILVLKAARAAGHDVRGATAYVSLEPCSHFGRTPPCAGALIEAGVAVVVAAMEDPNPLVSGSGLQALRAAGIEVRCGLLEAEARELNIGFVSRMTRGLPWVRLKVAASLDGGTALPNGQSQWITGQAARDDGHAWRARACTILTGIGTVRDDDPQLNVRAVDTPRQPRKVVVDSKFRIDEQAKILRGGEAIIATAADLNVFADKVQRLADHSVRVLHLPNTEGKVDLKALMHELADTGTNELHVEAGNRLNGALLQAGCVDELLVYQAPCVLGEARGMFHVGPLENLEQRHQFAFHTVERIGEDLRLTLRRQTPEAAGGPSAAPPDTPPQIIYSALKQ